MLKFLLKPAQNILKLLEHFGRYCSLIANIFRSYNSWYDLMPKSVDQMIYIGTRSVPIVILTSFFTGLVSSVQAAYQMESSLVPDWYIGSLVGETLILGLKNSN